MKIFILVMIMLVPANALAAGWTTWAKIVELAQNGGDTVMIKFDTTVGQCGDYTRLYYKPSEAGQPDLFYSTLLSAYMGEKQVTIHLHDPVTCGGFNSQKIKIPDYIQIRD